MTPVLLLLALFHVQNLTLGAPASQTVELCRLVNATAAVVPMDKFMDAAETAGVDEEDAAQFYENIDTCISDEAEARRVSKLWVTDATGAVAFNYDRGLDVDSPIGAIVASELEAVVK